MSSNIRKIPKRTRIFYFKKDPPNTRRVSRPSKFGNPYSLKEYSREDSIRLYSEWLDNQIKECPDFLEELFYVDFLGCFCKENDECHADIIISKMIEIIQT